MRSAEFSIMSTQIFEHFPRAVDCGFLRRISIHVVGYSETCTPQCLERIVFSSIVGITWLCNVILLNGENVNKMKTGYSQIAF